MSILHKRILFPLKNYPVLPVQWTAILLVQMGCAQAEDSVCAELVG